MWRGLAACCQQARLELRTAHRATQGHTGPHRATQEATGCHGWLAAPAPVGGSTSRARGLSSLAAAAVAVAGGSLA